MTSTVFLVEDDPGIARAVIEGLERRGFRVVHAASVAEAQAQLTELEPVVCLLDVMLPDGSGLDVLQSVRLRAPAIPICMLTARDAVDDKLDAFKAGADDYLTKPFDLRELAARIEVLIRRGLSKPTANPPQRVAAGNVSADLDARTVTVAGAELVMTRREFDLLSALLTKPGAVFSRDQLLTRVWPQSKAVNQNTVDVYISYLRNKLQGAEATVTLSTIRGVGFRLDVSR